MNKPFNVIDKVLDAVLNHDRGVLGLLAFESDLEGVSEEQFALYSPTFETRLDLIAYDLAWIIYIKHNTPPNVDDFRKFMKYDNRGRELFNKAREMAKPRLDPKLSYRQLTKNRKRWYNRIMITDAIFSILKIALFVWIGFFVLGAVLVFVVPTACRVVVQHDRNHNTDYAPYACEYLVKQMEK